MKRIFAFFCALVLFLTGFPITAGFGAEIDIVAEETAQDLVVVEPKEKELFPDLPPNTALFSTRNTALEHTLPDGFMEYLLEHFGNGETSFSIEQFNIPHSRWDELTSVIWHETPELFHVKTLGCTYYQSTDVIVDVTVTYLPYADTAAEYDTCLDKMLSGAEYLLQGIKGNNALTDVEKALILHDCLAVWTEYDVEGANTTNTYNKIHTAYSALGEGSAVCQGYAMAYMYLLEQAGIESDYCSSDVLNHGWNIVYIDGTPYHVDVTWDDPTTSNATYNDIYGRVYHRNFMLSSEGIWNTGHEANDYNTTPTDTQYDSESATAWWKASTTAVQLIDNNLYYLDKNSGKVICADDGSTIHTLADSSSAYRLSSAEGMLLCSTYYDVKTVDPKTGVSSVVYTPENGYIEGMKYEKGKLWVQLNDGNGNSRRESMDYVEPEVTDFTYTVENGKATITGYTGTGGDITIPATLGGYPVTQIGENAFNNCTTLTSLTIPDSVTTIDSYAFHWCENLTSVTIPDSVTTIGDAAFNGCDSLASVTIGNSVTTIGNDAFRGCPSLTSVTIPDSVTAIGESAFSNCTGLTSVTIPSKVTTISNYLFYYCPNLTSVTIPTSVTTIGYYAFGDCPELTDVYYDGAESQWEAVSVGTGNGCLQNATIHYIDYTYTVENGEATITGYTGTGSNITIPDTQGGYPVTLIGEAAFYECTSLISVKIPNSVTKIGEWAFLSCNKLTTVNIPDSVTIIGEGAFYGCSYLNGVEIPDNVTKIGVDAFAGCIRLTSITIPSSVTAIYEGTFYYCENLTTVTIPDSVTYIGESAFANCTKLTDVYYDGTEEQWNSISVGEGNEYLQNATKHFAIVPEKIDFTYTVENGEATITGYTGAGGDITIPDTLGGYPVTAIGESAFRDCTALTSAVIPDSVITIGTSAFWGCNSLASVTIGSSVNTIENSAFRDCSSLTTVTIPDSVVIIDNNVFSECNSLTSVIIGDSVTTIGEYAFYCCTSLNSVIFGDSVTTIGDFAFAVCTSLTSVTIPDSVTVVGNYAFACAVGYTSNLTSVTIGSGVSTIGNFAFSLCNSLSNVYYNGTEEQWNSISVGEGNESLQNATIHCAKEPEVPEVTDYTYTVENGEATITGYTGAGGDVIIPSTLDGYHVTEIGEWAFHSCTSLTSVTIPDSVTTIGGFAFYYCENLTSVTIPYSVTYIGERAFEACPELTDAYYIGTKEQWESVSVGIGNEYLQNAAIHCTKEPENTDYIYTVENGKATITGYTGTGGDITIPDTMSGYPVTAIGERAFRDCTALTAAVIPDSVTSVGAYAFYDCICLESVKLPDGMTVIGESMFDGCSSLMEIVIPDSVISIEKWAFYACENLTDVTFGKRVARIGFEAFFQCFKLKSIALPDSLTTIGEGAFRECNELSDVDLGDGVITIGKEAFYNCYSLTAVTIPKNTVSIGEYAFGTCDRLTGIWVDEDNTAYSSDKYGVLFNKDKTVLLQAPCGNYNGLTHYNSYVVPYGVLIIGKSAFYDCRLLHALTLPDSLTEVQKEAFETCVNLSYVYYSGSQNRWDEINIDLSGAGYGNEYLVNAIISYNHIHNYSLVKPVTVEATCTEEGYVEYTCIYGETNREYIPALGHDYTGAETTVAPTCTGSGISGPTCTHCNEIRPDRVTDALGHNMVAVEAKEAVCTQPGNSFGTQCSRCGIYGIQPEIYPALDHSFTDYRSNGDATCTSDGTETAKCDRCEVTDTRTVWGSALGHRHTAKVTKPTCTAKGYTTYTCSCGDTYKDNYVNVTSHSYAAATCTKSKTCKVCKATSGKALGHTYKSGLCTRCKYKPAGAKITTQPVNVAVKNGKAAKVTVKATGSGLKYTWYYAKKGAKTYTKTTVTTNTYSVKMSNSVNGGKVYCVVTDAYGNSVKSNVVTLYKGTAAKITTQPKSTTVANGKTGSITLKASGSSLKYQWYIKYKGASSFTKVGKSSKTYSFKMASKLNGAQVYCVVKDKYGIEVKSSVVTIKMPVQPKITAQPKSVKAFSGKTVKFTVKASGEGLKYQWYYAKKGSSKFKKLSAKSATYSVKVSSSVDGRRYYCVVTDKYGQTVKSSVVTLTMQQAAKITTQPKNVSVKNGKTAKVTIKATGDGLKYTWYYLLSGQTKYQKASFTGNTFSVKMSVKYKNAKVYCTIADQYGNSVKSKTVNLKMK